MAAPEREAALRYIRQNPGCTMREMADAGAVTWSPRGRGIVRDLAARHEVRAETSHAGGTPVTRWYPAS